MCMKIKEVPATKKDALCIPCKKVLSQGSLGYTTVFMNKNIPKDGLLIKSGKVPRVY